MEKKVGDGQSTVPPAGGTGDVYDAPTMTVSTADSDIRKLIERSRQDAEDNRPDAPKVPAAGRVPVIENPDLEEKTIVDSSFAFQNQISAARAQAPGAFPSSEPPTAKLRPPMMASKVATARPPAPVPVPAAVVAPAAPPPRPIAPAPAFPGVAQKVAPLPLPSPMAAPPHVSAPRPPVEQSAFNASHGTGTVKMTMTDDASDPLVLALAADSRRKRALVAAIFLVIGVAALVALAWFALQ